MLNQQQIDYLFTFCEKHYVRYYEVQIELVDHLANSAEEEMDKNPTLSFENAVKKVYAGFGVMGFAPLVAEKIKFAERKTMKLFWKHFKEKFRLPKVLAFFLLTISFYTLFTANIFLINWIFWGIILFFVPLFFYSLISFQRKIKKSGKNFLATNFSWLSSPILLPLYFFNTTGLLKNSTLLNFYSNTLSVLGISVFLSIYIIGIIAVCQTFFSVKDTLLKNYPEAFVTV